MTARVSASFGLPARPMAALRGPILVAAALAVLFFGAFGGWAALAPLTSAAVAPGFIGVDTRRKTVQHLEGGIISELRVREGDHVVAGQVLLRLDETVAHSTLQLMEGQHDDMLAEEARLLAERARAERIDFPEALVSRREIPRVRQAMQSQLNLFDTRLQAKRSKIEVLGRRILETREQIAGFEVQIDSLRTQLGLIDEEITSVKTLVDQGLARKPRLLELQREAANLEGRIGELISRIAQGNLRIGEAELEILDLETRLINQVTGDLRSLQQSIADMAPRLRASRDAVARLEVRAPEEGDVVGLRFHTVGGVIPPGGAILDIVPTGTDFVIEAQVSPSDIDVVRPGLPAEVRLTAMAGRNIPSLTGEVILVSADRLVDEASGMPYYAVHVRLDREQAEPVDPTQLYPGMPVEVMLVTGERTTLDYLLGPVNQTFARAFREQ